MIAFAFSPLALLACTADTVKGTEPPSLPDASAEPDTGPSSPDSGPPGQPISVPSDTQQIVAQSSIDAKIEPDASTTCGPADPIGISFDDRTFTFAPATKDLSWKVCVIPSDVGPQPPSVSGTYDVGHRVLSDAEVASVNAALAATRITTQQGCIADIPPETLTVSTSSGDTTYHDATSACGAQFASLSLATGLDGVFQVLAGLAH